MWIATLIFTAMALAALAVIAYPFVRRGGTVAPAVRAEISALRQRRGELYARILELQSDDSAPAAKQKEEEELKAQAAELLEREERLKRGERDGS